MRMVAEGIVIYIFVASILNMIATAHLVGQPRKNWDGTDVVQNMFITALMAVLLIYFYA